jgi:hypothetical protein
MTTEAYELPELPNDIQSAKDLLRVFSPERVETMMREYARAAIRLERERYVLSYMALAEAMGYNERGRENELESPEEYAARLFSAAIRAG